MRLMPVSQCLEIIMCVFLIGHHRVFAQAFSKRRRAGSRREGLASMDARVLTFTELNDSVDENGGLANV